MYSLAYSSSLSDKPDAAAGACCVVLVRLVGVAAGSVLMEHPTTIVVRRSNGIIRRGSFGITRTTAYIQSKI